MIFAFFYACVKFVFILFIMYVFLFIIIYVFFTEHECLKRKLKKMGTYLFLVSKSFPEMIDINNNE